MNVFSWVRRRRPVSKLLIAALSLVACRSEQARAFEAEVAGLARNIDALRDAPNEGKAPLLEQLKTAACNDARVCALKSQCIRAYQEHGAGLEGSERARQLLSLGDGDRVAALAAATELKQAEERLASAKELTERCATAEGELQRAAKAER